MQKRKDEVENSMNQSANNDLKYQELLILAYFKTHYKKYEFNDIAQIMGMTYVEMRDCIEHLLELNYLLCIESYLVLSKVAEELLEERKLINFFNKRKIEVCQKERLNVEEPYVPIGFKM